MVKEMKIPVIINWGNWDRFGLSTRELSKMIEMFCILIGVWVTQVIEFIKADSIVHLIFVHFIV